MCVYLCLHSLTFQRTLTLIIPFKIIFSNLKHKFKAVIRDVIELWLWVKKEQTTEQSGKWEERLFQLSTSRWWAWRKKVQKQRLMWEKGSMLPWGLGLPIPQESPQRLNLQLGKLPHYPLAMPLLSDIKQMPLSSFRPPKANWSLLVSLCYIELGFYIFGIQIIRVLFLASSMNN